MFENVVFNIWAFHVSFNLVVFISSDVHTKNSSSELTPSQFMQFLKVKFLWKCFKEGNEQHISIHDYFFSYRQYHRHVHLKEKEPML